MAAFLIGVYAGQPPAQYIVDYFLPRLGVDNRVMNYTADPKTDALEYYDAADTVTGLSLTPWGLVGGTGLISSVRQYLNFLMGMRQVFPRSLLQLMLCGNTGPTQPEGPNGGSLGWNSQEAPMASCAKRMVAGRSRTTGFRRGQATEPSTSQEGSMR